MPFIGTTPTQGFVSSFPKQSFTPNGSTTVFTLTNPVATANDLEVFVGNVRQEPTTAYTAAGTTLTMSEAPATGLNFYVINKSFAQVTTTPPVNSISTDKIVNDAVTSAKIATNAVGSDAVDLTASYAFTGTVSGTGMNLLLDATISSAVSEYDISSTYINSTYDTYYLDAAFHPSSDDTIPYMRPIVGGSVVTTGIEYSTYGIENGLIYGNNTSYIRLARSPVGNEDGESITISGHLQNVNSTTIPFAFSALNNIVKIDGQHEGSICTGGLIVGSRASVVNGIRFYFSSGNIESGTVKLYGLRT